MENKHIKEFKVLLEMIRDISGEKNEGYIALKEAIELVESKNIN